MQSLPIPGLLLPGNQFKQLGPTFLELLDFFFPFLSVALINTSQVDFVIILIKCVIKNNKMNLGIYYEFKMYF